MYHTIEFAMNFWVDLVRSPNQPLERVQVLRGMRCRAQLRPRIVETDQGLFEVADLYFEDGTAAFGVPFASFAFSESTKA